MTENKDTAKNRVEYIADRLIESNKIKDLDRSKLIELLSLFKDNAEKLSSYQIEIEPS